jgi:hypothetical protein
MKKTLVLFAFLSVALGCMAQEFSVPKDYKLVAKEDYAPYENDILGAIEWLENTPIIDQQTKRKEVNAFLFKWITGSPYVDVTIGEIVMPFLENKQSQSVIIFLAGWVKYALTTKDYDNQVEGSIAGVDAIIKFYNKNKQWTGKDKSVEKYIKMQQKGTLKEYVEKIVAKEKGETTRIR